MCNIWKLFKTDAEGGGHQEWQRGQDNFKLAANFGYNSRGSADPRESLRKRRISKLPLTAPQCVRLFPPPLPPVPFSG